MEFSKKLKDLMKKKRIEPKNLIRDLNISSGLVYEWLRGDKIPRIKRASQLADYFNITLDELFDRKNKDDTQDTAPIQIKDITYEELLEQLKQATKGWTAKEIEGLIIFLNSRQKK